MIEYEAMIVVSNLILWQVWKLLQIFASTEIFRSSATSKAVPSLVEVWDLNEGVGSVNLQPDEREGNKVVPQIWLAKLDEETNKLDDDLHSRNTSKVTFHHILRDLEKVGVLRVNWYLTDGWPMKVSIQSESKVRPIGSDICRRAMGAIYGYSP